MLDLWSHNRLVCVHHISYDNLDEKGEEDIDNDLITLCVNCHRKIHEIKDRDAVREYEAQEHFREKVAAAVWEPLVRYEQWKRRRIAHYMEELPIEKRPGVNENVETLLKKTVGLYGSIVFRFSPNPKRITVYLPVKGVPAVSLLRVMRGKKKPGSDIQTPRDWDGKWDEEAASGPKPIIPQEVT